MNSHVIFARSEDVAAGGAASSANVSTFITSRTSAFTLAFIAAVRSPAVGAFVKFVTVVSVPAVMFVGVARPLWISATASAASAEAFITFALMLLTVIPVAAVMFVVLATVTGNVAAKNPVG